MATPQVQTEPTAGDILDAYDSGDKDRMAAALVIVEASYDGASWASFVNESYGFKPLFCPPKGIALTGRQLLVMLRRSAKDHPAHDDVPPTEAIPMGLAVTMMAIDAFPCEH